MTASLERANLEEEIKRLLPFASEKRLETIERVLKWRTRHFTVVLEDIYHPPNASAVIRTCDCFGIQDAHVIQNEKIFKLNTKVVQGSAKWMTIRLYRTQDENNTVSCLESLKERGYKIAATTLRNDLPLMTPDDLPIDDKLALCFGTEETGLSETAHEMADYYCQVPMYGFTRSYNISVTAALCLSQLTKRLHASEQRWNLSEQEKLVLRHKWYKQSVRNADAILNHLKG